MLENTEQDIQQDIKEISLDPENPEIKVLIGANMPQDAEQDMISFLKKRQVFLRISLLINLVWTKIAGQFIIKEENSHLKEIKSSKKKWKDL